MKSPLALVLCALAAIAVGCAPAIGDDCESALDCSSQGSRQCDRTQPGGYCTIAGCERGTCPEDSVCVRFRPALERIATTYCMAECEEDDDCRDDEGYRCTSQTEFSGGLAEVLDGRRKRFCSIPLLMSLPRARDDAGMSSEPPPDAAADDDAGL